VTPSFPVVLWAIQRLSAVVLAAAVAIHLGVIVYAVHAGLSAAAILGRTRGNELGMAFYGAFVLAAAVHGGIGLRTVLREHTGRPLLADRAAAVFTVGVALAGWRAVGGLFA
jgi:fumarate reductase subunit C